VKTIGLLGGMSWESTETYYRIINEEVKRRLGGLHSAEICLYSVDFDPIEKLQHAGNWAATAEILSQAAKRIESGGADFLVICTNTMHKVAAEIEGRIHIPILHIADATAEKITAAGIKTIGLIGTNFTMEQGAEGIILGCTEIASLIQQEHTPVKLFDTTRIHALRAVETAFLV
jgi:aspartate racemase